MIKALIFVTALVVLPLSAGAQLLQPYTSGHMDIGVRLEAGNLVGYWKNDTAIVNGVTNSTEEFAANQIQALGIFDAATPAPIRPASPSWNFLGVAAGEPIYILPSSGDPTTIPYLGFSTENPSLPDLDEITFSLTGFSGPAGSTFNLYTSSSAVFMTGTNISTIGSVTLEKGNHEHYNWAFSHLGVYDLTLSFLDDSGDYSGSSTFQFAIVPEPSSMWLLLMAGLGLLIFRRGRLPKFTANLEILKKSEKHGRRVAAFTLVETLVTVAIVGLLAAIVMTVVSRALVSAKTVKCASNMRQIGLAILTYSGERGGQLPPTRHSASRDQAWIYQIADYLDNVDEVRISPADPNGAERLRRGGTSYLANDLIFDQRTDAFGDVLEGSIGSLMRIENPGRTILGFTVSDNRGTGASNDHTHANQWNSFNRFLADVEADRHRVGGRSPNRDRGSAHYLYADGSLRTFTSEQMRDWITAGNNPGMVNSAP